MANSNRFRGIDLGPSSNNNLTDNNASNNGIHSSVGFLADGISLEASSNNNLTGNTANSNTDTGILFQYSDYNNTLTGNTVNSNNQYGIQIDSSYNNTLTGNTVNSNGFFGGIYLFGIYLFSSSNNLIYNNYFNNTNNAHDDGNNSWNTTKQKGTNIVGGPYLGGNFWSDYKGTDTDGDGLGDTLVPYNNSGNIIYGGDYLPLVIPSHNISSCPAIFLPGNYVLTANLSSSSTCINITSSNVILDGAGYTINGTNVGGSYGVYVNSGTTTTLTNVTVENLTVTNWDTGIYYNNIQEGNILNNIANSNYIGISLSSSSNNTLTGNTANLTPFGGSGFRLDTSSNNNTLNSNTANQNGGTGIILDASNGNILNYSNASSNGDIGIWLTDSSNNNSLINNTLNQNGFGSRGSGHTGLLISSSSNNTVFGSTASGNQRGFVLSSAINNTLSSNNLSLNAQTGIYLSSSSNNLIYNNYFNNTNNAIDNGINIWNTTKQAGTNIIGGSYLGGNFWSDYKGTDLDCDGIGDTLLPYNSSGNITNGGDFLPLVFLQFDFNLTASPQNQTVSPNGNALFTVTATLLCGTPQNVNLSVTVVNATTNLPEPSIINSTSPSTVLPTSNSTLFIGTNSSTPNGVYNATVTGTSGTLQRTVNVSVIVSGKPICTNPIGCSSFTVNLTNGTPITFANQINVPLTGSFVIVLVNGSNFSVVDNDATDGLAVIRVIDNSFYKFYGRVTAGANITVLSPFIPGVLMPQAVTRSKTSSPTTVDLTSLYPYILQIPAPASEVDSANASKPWVPQYYPSIGLPYKFNNSGALNTQLIFVKENS